MGRKKFAPLTVKTLSNYYLTCVLKSSMVNGPLLRLTQGFQIEA